MSVLVLIDAVGTARRGSAGSRQCVTTRGAQEHFWKSR